MKVLVSISVIWIFIVILLSSSKSAPTVSCDSEEDSSSEGLCPSSPKR